MPLSLADQAYGLLAGSKPMEPFFADLAERRRVMARYRDKLRHSKRFYLDDEITRTTVQLGYEHPDMLRAMLSRARTPFPMIWIEWPLDVALAEVGIEKEEDAPDRIGCIVEALHESEPLYRMTMVYANPGRASVSPLSILYHLTKPINEAAKEPSEVGQIIQRHPIFAVADASKKQVISHVGFLLGSAYTEPATGKTELEVGEAEFRVQQCEALAAHAKLVYSPQMGESYFRLMQGQGPRDQRALNVATQLLTSDALEQAGTWRFVVSILAMINSKDRLHLESAGRSGDGRRFVNGAMVPFLDHIMVKLKLPRKDAIQRLMREVRASIPRRRHDVMGHWKYRRKGLIGDPDCDHVWVEVSATNEKCTICGWHRWWQKDTMRGSAEVGIITKDRLVTR